MSRRWLWIIGAVIFIFLVLAVFSGEDEPSDRRDLKKPGTNANSNTNTNKEPADPKPRALTSITGEKGDAKIHDAGWSTPVKLQFNDAGWEDSPFITRDGSQILLFYHPNDRLADPSVIEKITEEIVKDIDAAIKNGIDGKVYVSDRPFVSKSIHPISQNKRLPSAQACPYISASGELFICSNEESWVQGKGLPSVTYTGGKRLEFGTGEDENNPHYCDAMDEMWFDCPTDTNLCVMRNAKKQEYKGEVTFAPYPLNHGGSDVSDFQAYLTDDCKTLYFTSSRDGGILSIYRTDRLDDIGDKWSAPQKFISHPAGVAELSMTADGAEMVWAQLFWRDDDSPGLDIWYSQKGGK